MITIRRAAVLGAGTMGSRIAAHLANAGVPALLLDLIFPGESDRNAAATRGLELAAKQKPGAFYSDAARRLISVGNFEDDLGRLADCDWVIEAVIENLDVKRELWRRVLPHVRPDSILSTNTSGLPLAAISEGFPGDCRRRFLAAHFFNPPRQLHLVEIVPGEATDPALVDGVASFCDLRLGKGVVRAKDTPNFIANRIGCFLSATAQRIMVEDGYTIEEVDALTGPLIGLPRSASFRLLDIVGLDVWGFIGRNLYEAVPGDPWRDRFLPLGYFEQMVERGWLGEKTGQGFYRRAELDGRRVIEVIDWRSLNYHAASEPDFPSVATARSIEDLGSRLRFLVRSEDRAGRFLWRWLSDLFLYSAERVPEVSDRVVEIDRAMRWGYAFRMGPFELWDALGFDDAARRILGEGRALPASIEAMLSAGARSFYRPADAGGKPCTEYFDLRSAAYGGIEERPGILSLAEWKRARGVIRQNGGASLVDLGDGVLAVEFHSKMNALGEDAFRMIQAGLEETARNFEAMVIANQGEHFSAGANLQSILLAAQERYFDEIEVFLRLFQDVNMAVRHAPKPVVAAPFGYALGGGCELVLHAAGVQASAELSLGLVEVNVGLIPSAGGACRLLQNLGPDKAFDRIGQARVSSSAADAKALGLLSGGDAVTMNPERLVADAKAMALALSRNYVPPAAGIDVEVGGEPIYARLRMEAWQACEAGRISTYDREILGRLAGVLSGGRLTGKQLVSEQYLLDLEREAFLSLCGDSRTQDRISHMLRTGKPLKN